MHSREEQQLIEKEQWEKLKRVGQTRFVLRTFLTAFALLISALLVNEYFSVAPDWRPFRVAIKFLIAFLISLAVTIVGAVGTWQDLEKQFGSASNKPD